MTRMRRIGELALAGTVAGVVIACGDSMLDAGGTAMQDAGDWLTDAGTALAGSGADMGDAGSVMRMGGQMLQDAGAMMGDAGGRMNGTDDAGMLADAAVALQDAGGMLHDAGAALRDGSANVGPDGATAQSSCGNCSAGNTQRVMVASEDPAQLRGESTSSWTLVKAAAVTGVLCGYSVEDRAYYAELGDGPLLLTDALATQGGAALYTVPSGDSCVATVAPSVTVLAPCGGTAVNVSLTEVVRPPSSSRQLMRASTTTQITGARLWIPQGQMLCALTSSSGPTATTAQEGAGTSIVWSGFVPYD